MSWTQAQLLRGPQQMNTHGKLQLSYFWKCLREEKKNEAVIGFRRALLNTSNQLQKKMIWKFQLMEFAS